MLALVAIVSARPLRYHLLRRRVIATIIGLLSTAPLVAAAGVAAQSLDWVRNPGTGHWYAIVYDMTWADGEAYAVSLGGHLATINDKAEDRWISATFPDAIIGFNDLAQEGDWVWASGEPVTYTNWAPGEPTDDDNEGHSEDIGSVNFENGNGTWAWNDLYIGYVDHVLLEVVSPVAPPADVPTATPNPTLTPSPTPNPTLTPSPTPSAAPTMTPSPTPSAAPTMTPPSPAASASPQASPHVVPIILVGLPPIAAITTSGEHSCLLGTDGSVWCWGGNSHGQLGVAAGQVASSDAPLKIEGLPGPTREVVAFGESTCALTESGEVWCWGANWEGVLGDGSATDHATPAAVMGLPTGIAHLATSGTISNMCALDSLGVAYCWGDNSVGALGDGTTETRAGAVRVTVVDEPLSEVSAAGATTCGLTERGAVRCWGLLWNGDLSGRVEPGSSAGLNEGTSAVTPKGLAGGVAGLSADGDIACVVMSDGTVRCWSWGIFEQTAVMAWRPPDVPTTVDGLPGGIDAVTTSSWIRTEPGTSDVAVAWACAISDGEAWCWGDNDLGQLGDGTLVDRPAPAHVQTVGLQQLVAGPGASLALGRDGVVLTWGDSDPTPRSPFSAAPASGGGYRQPDTWVPGITTHIPTPEDISTDPYVAGTNLLLAGLVMLAFTIATELLNRSLSELEPALARLLPIARRLDRALVRLDAATVQPLAKRNRRLADGARLAGIAAFYGFAFAFLDPTWNPLSVTGVWLVLMMATAVGVVGLGGDIAAWAVGRRWGLAGELEIRAGSLLAAVGSTLVSRAVALVPGVMIGSPEAIDIDPDRIDQRRLGRIAAAGLGTVLLIGLAAWAGTLATSALRGNSQTLDLALGGAEAFLLLVFAFAVQNGFAQLLSVRQSAGLALRRTHRVVWGVALLLVTFTFWHTLVNPHGDLAAALQATNVQAFLATAGVVLVLSLAVWIGSTVARRRAIVALRVAAIVPAAIVPRASRMPPLSTEPPVLRVGDDEPVEATALLEVDLQRTFKHGPKALAEKLDIDTGRAKALRWHLGIEFDPACRHDFVFGKMKVPMYSDRALERMRRAIAGGANLNDVRRAYQAAGRP